MEKSEFNKVVNYIEGSFGRTLSQNELLVLGKELKDYPYEKFDKEVKDVLLKISYFTVAELHRILENIRVSELFYFQKVKMTNNITLRLKRKLEAK